MWINSLLLRPLKALHRIGQRYIWLNYVYGDLSRPVKRNEVNVYYWKRPQSDNVGDLLSDVVVRLEAVHKGLDIEQKISSTRRMFAIGSVIDAARCDITVWGSGLHHHGACVPKVSLDVRAVRGPYTRELLRMAGVECPEVFGDPAILLPMFYMPEVNKMYDYTVIPHFSKEAGYTDQKDFFLSTLTSDWKAFIDRIVASKLVISGSLHGIILAEAYGVPAIALNDIDTDWFKYDDYYLGTNRSIYPKASSVAEARAQTPTAVPNFSQMRSELLAAFPDDLWRVNF